MVPSYLLGENDGLEYLFVIVSICACVCTHLYKKNQTMKLPTCGQMWRNNFRVLITSLSQDLEQNLSTLAPPSHFLAVTCFSLIL